METPHRPSFVPRPWLAVGLGTALSALVTQSVIPEPQPRNIPAKYDFPAEWCDLRCLATGCACRVSPAGRRMWRELSRLLLMLNPCPAWNDCTCFYSQTTVLRLQLGFSSLHCSSVNVAHSASAQPSCDRGGPLQFQRLLSLCQMRLTAACNLIN